MPTPRDLIVAVHDYNNPPVKLVRIAAGRDGSLSISAPYHPAQTGLLFKVPAPGVVYPSGGGVVALASAHRVSSRVKLSIHPSGFVQFSSVGRTPIRSGRGRFSVPKGLGVQSQPFTDPIETGPTFGLRFFAAGVCDRLSGPERARTMVFRPGDFFERDAHVPHMRHVYTVEGFIFPFVTRREAILGRNGWILQRPYSPLRPEWPVEFRVFDLPTQIAFLGIVVTLEHHDRATAGDGYAIGGPRDIGSGLWLNGLFPARDEDDKYPSLDFEAKDDAGRAGAT